MKMLMMKESLNQNIKTSEMNNVFHKILSNVNEQSGKLLSSNFDLLLVNLFMWISKTSFFYRKMDFFYVNFAREFYPLIGQICLTPWVFLYI